MTILQTTINLQKSIETLMKNPEMLKFVRNHLKTKKMGKNAVKKMPFVIRYVPDRFPIDKAVLENGRTLESFPDCYKIEKCAIKLLIITLMH